MASLKQRLEELHEAVVQTVTERIQEGGRDAEGNPAPASAEDLRIALQLLKQNNITADLGEEDKRQLKAAMAAKLNFSAVTDKRVRSAPIPLPMTGASGDPFSG